MRRVATLAQTRAYSSGESVRPEAVHAWRENTGMRRTRLGGRHGTHAAGRRTTAVARGPHHWIVTAIGSSGGEPPLGCMSLLMHEPAGFDA